MDTLMILGATGVLIVAFVVFRVLRKSAPLDRRINDWAKGQGLSVLEVEKISDHSMDLGLPGSGSHLVGLKLQDSKGRTYEARVRFDVAAMGKDSEQVQWTKRPEEA